MANLLKLLEPLLKITDTHENQSNSEPNPPISEKDVARSESTSQQSKPKTKKQTKTQESSKTKKTIKKPSKKSLKKLKKQKKHSRVTKKNFL